MQHLHLMFDIRGEMSENLNLWFNFIALFIFSCRPFLLLETTDRTQELIYVLGNSWGYKHQDKPTYLILRCIKQHHQLNFCFSVTPEESGEQDAG